MCVCRGVSVVVMLAAGIWLAPAAEPPKSGPKGEDALLKRGEYLVTEVAGCTHCHSPPGDKARMLQGAELPIQPKQPTKNWADKAPDLTRSGLAGKWKEADLVKFLTTGKNPDGEAPTPPMPAFHLHDDDARAVAAYLRSLPGSKGR